MVPKRAKWLSVNAIEWLAGIGVCVLVAALSVGLFIRKHHQQEKLTHLYLEAAGVSPYFRGTADAERAVTEIGSVKGPEADQALIALAKSTTYLPGPQVQVAAIKELIRRRPDGAADSLASLVDPQTPLQIRSAAARALVSLPCSTNCVADIIEYLHKIHDGSVNIEDVMPDVPDPEFMAKVKEDRSKGEQEVYRSLYRALSQNTEETDHVLRTTYGLSKQNPSVFAIRTADLSRDTRACGTLIEMRRGIWSNKEYDTKVRDSLQEAVKDLGCSQ